MTGSGGRRRVGRLVGVDDEALEVLDCLQHQVLLLGMLRLIQLHEPELPAANVFTSYTPWPVNKQDNYTQLRSLTK